MPEVLPAIAAPLTPGSTWRTGAGTRLSATQGRGALSMLSMTGEVVWCVQHGRMQWLPCGPGRRPCVTPDTSQTQRGRQRGPLYAWMAVMSYEL